MELEPGPEVSSITFLWRPERATTKELIDNAKEKKLIIFIGAGLSTNCGLPNWNDLVIEILNEKKEYIEKADILKDSIEVFGALEVLEKIKEHKKHIYDVFDKKLSVKINDSNLHKLLGKISRKFITTNFDSIIEFSLNINTVILKDSNYKLQQLDTAEEYVLKIHGDIGSWKAFDGAASIPNLCGTTDYSACATFRAKWLYLAHHRFRKNTH